MEYSREEKGKVNDIIRIYIEGEDYSMDELYKINFIDKRFSAKIYYEAQSLDELIDIKFLEEYEFEVVK
jgi:hypothetical protein